MWCKCLFCLSTSLFSGNKTKKSHTLGRTKHLSACVVYGMCAASPLTPLLFTPPLVLFSSVDEVAISMQMTWSKPLKIKSVGGFSLRVEITKSPLQKSPDEMCCIYSVRPDFFQIHTLVFFYYFLFASFPQYAFQALSVCGLFGLSVSRTLLFSFARHGEFAYAPRPTWCQTHWGAEVAHLGALVWPERLEIKANVDKCLPDGCGYSIGAGLMRSG